MEPESYHHDRKQKTMVNVVGREVCWYHVQSTNVHSLSENVVIIQTHIHTKKTIAVAMSG